MNDLMSRSFKQVRHGEEGGEDLESGKKQQYPPSVQLTNSKKADAESMAEFFREIGVVQGEVNKVKQLLLQLQRANEESRGVHRAEAFKSLRAQMDADIAAVMTSARFMKGKLVGIDQSNIAHRQLPGCGAGTALDRQRMSLTENQRKKLKELMEEFQSLRGKMVDEYKDTITRRYYNITGKQADDETIETMIRTGESETFLQQAIREQGRGHVIDTIREIQERHDGVKEIERHLLELHAIFVDISVLVDAQGHLINDIEANVMRATSYTRDGAKHLDIARRYQLSKRKWTLVCTLLLLVVLLVVILVVLKQTKVI